MPKAIAGRMICLYMRSLFWHYILAGAARIYGVREGSRLIGRYLGGKIGGFTWLMD